MNIVELTNVEMKSIHDMVEQRIKNYEAVKCGALRFNLDTDMCNDAIGFWTELNKKFYVPQMEITQKDIINTIKKGE